MITNRLKKRKKCAPKILILPSKLSVKEKKAMRKIVDREKENKVNKKTCCTVPNTKVPLGESTLVSILGVDLRIFFTFGHRKNPPFS